MFFGADRHGSLFALKEILGYGFEVVGCVSDSMNRKQLFNFCEKYSIPYYEGNTIYEEQKKGSLPEFDFGISYLYAKILKEPIIGLAKQGMINFHPAPVQEHRGIAACCYCLLNGYREWMVTALFIVPEIDAGDIIMERAFPIGNVKTAIELEKLVQKESLLLLKDVMGLIASGTELPRKKQDTSRGAYFSRKDIEDCKATKVTDVPEEIDRKIKALWFPPYHGAYIVIGGKKYSLVSEELLNDLEKLYR